MSIENGISETMGWIFLITENQIHFNDSKWSVSREIIQSKWRLIITTIDFIIVISKFKFNKELEALRSLW